MPVRQRRSVCVPLNPLPPFLTPLLPLCPITPFMLNRDPEGYKKLLAYQKAKVLHEDVAHLVSYFPKTKTYADLADQMARSGRSGNKNIVHPVRD